MGSRDSPEAFETEQLLIRSLLPGDGAEIPEEYEASRPQANPPAALEDLSPSEE